MNFPATPAGPGGGLSALLKRDNAAPAVAACYLQPGKLLVSAQPREITTVLGSCIAVTLHDEALAVGGMNHFMLPLWSGTDTASPRFGDVAIARLLEQMAALGSNRAALRARLFGGACVIGAFRGNARHLGVQNAELARELLREAGIRVVEERVGGTRGLRLKFRTDTGECQASELAGG